MKLCFAMWILLAMATAALFGCGAGQSPNSPSVSTHVDKSKYLLASEPEGGQNVLDVRTSAADGQDIIVVGRIGGSRDPWVDGCAAFTIVDPSLKACSDRDDDTCPTPWDYCCETKEQLAKSSLLVKLVDPQGQLLKVDARDSLGLKELQTVVVRGKVQRDDAGTFSVLANEVFVR